MNIKNIKSLKGFILPAIGVIGVFLAIRVVFVSSRPVITAQPVTSPVRAPYERFIAGVGIIESNSENITIAPFRSGVVHSVSVKAGDVVTQGDILFELDDRDVQAEFHVLEAQVAAAEAKAKKTEGLLALREAMSAKGAVSAEEVKELRLTLEVDRSDVTSAKARAEQTRTELERLKVRAPISATILQVRVRPGEFAPAQVIANPLMILGALEPLHLRIDIDENDAWRVKESAPGKAFLRGNPDISAEIEFVRFEPLVIPKRSLTGESSERVDTRVLQVIYKIPEPHPPLRVGQLMDVYIEER